MDSNSGALSGGQEGANRGVSRRSFLRGTSGAVLAGGAGLSLLLDACGGTAAPAASTGGGAPASASAGAGSAKSIKSVLPTYIKTTLPFKPQFPSTGPGIDDAYSVFPAKPFKSVTETPGTGSTVNFFSGTFWPPYTPAAQNPMLIELQKELNIKLNLAISNGADYAVKYNTMITGNDLPDVFWVGPTLNLPDFLKTKCADLTEFLAGDAVKNYPNLAALNNNTWKGAIFNGAIMGLPSPLGAMGTIMGINKSRWDAEIGANVVPKDPADLKKIFQELTKPKENKWAMASSITDPYGIDTGYFAMMFGSVNIWGIVNGKLTNYRETPAYKEAIAYTRDLVAAGVYHPKSATYDSIAAKADNAAGQFVGITSNAFYGNHVDMWNRGAALTPQVKFDLLPLVPAKAGAKPNFWLSDWIWPRNYLGPGIFAFKKASSDRVKEMLRIFNWIASPFGSQERLLWEYGVKGPDYTLKPNGDLAITRRGPQDSTDVPIRFGPHSYDQLYNPGTPDYGPTMLKNEQNMVPYGINDASLGAYSNTDGTKGISLNSAFRSIMVDIVASRSPMSAFDGALKAWQTNGGNQIRSEYEAGIAAS